MTTLLTFHNDPAIKEKYLARLHAHAAADRITKGQYWENGKGCAVGCTIEGNDHKRYETELGIPEGIAHLEDIIFEGLPNELAMTFPIRFLESIPVGVDLSHVVPSMMIFILKDRRIYADYQGKKAIDSVVALYQRKLNGEDVTVQEWKEAAEAAWAAWAAGAAEAAWAAGAARVAGVAGAAARAAAYILYADELIRLVSSSSR